MVLKRPFLGSKMMSFEISKQKKQWVTGPKMFKI